MRDTQTMTRTESILTTLVMEQIRTNELLTLQCRILLESTNKTTAMVGLARQTASLLERHDVEREAWAMKLRKLEVGTDDWLGRPGEEQ